MAWKETAESSQEMQPQSWCQEPLPAQPQLPEDPGKGQDGFQDPGEGQDGLHHAGKGEDGFHHPANGRDEFHHPGKGQDGFHHPGEGQDAHPTWKLENLRKSWARNCQ